jgi:hypothetical protein
MKNNLNFYREQLDKNIIDATRHLFIFNLFSDYLFIIILKQICMIIT